MKLLCLEASDIIAIVAIIIAIMIPAIQTIYERRREWHMACELLFQSMDSLYAEIKELTTTPTKTNHLSYQHCLNHRKNLLDHYGNRFILKKKRIKEACNIIISDLMNLPLDVKYEELINTGFKNKKKHDEVFYDFINKIRSYTSKASQALIE
ncbi:MAG: hypothetical protein LBU85_11825 [Treponema sp.]|jgi:hypothetical protein|nr:hypothetical protein [Treponema sp.]